MLGICEFSQTDAVLLRYRGCLNEATGLQIDDAIDRLAVLLAAPSNQGKESALLTGVGATRYRLDLIERVIAARKK